MIDERNPLLQALREQLETDQQQMLRCQRGEHDMLATASPGVVICRLCRTAGGVPVVRDDTASRRVHHGLF